MSKYITIRIQKVTGKSQRYRILTKRKSQYKRIKRGLYGKIKRVKVPRIPLPKEIPKPTGNTKAIAFLKISDYGADGHYVSFECWVSRVFAPDDTHKIDDWYNDSKTYMLDKLVTFGFSNELISSIIFGLELRQQSTTESVNSTEESFKYKHKGQTWKKL